MFAVGVSAEFKQRYSICWGKKTRNNPFLWQNSQSLHLLFSKYHFQVKLFCNRKGGLGPVENVCENLSLSFMKVLFSKGRSIIPSQDYQAWNALRSSENSYRELSLRMVVDCHDVCDVMITQCLLIFCIWKESERFELNVKRDISDGLQAWYNTEVTEGMASVAPGLGLVAPPYFG